MWRLYIWHKSNKPSLCTRGTRDIRGSGMLFAGASFPSVFAFPSLSRSLFLFFFSFSHLHLPSSSSLRLTKKKSSYDLQKRGPGPGKQPHRWYRRYLMSVSGLWAWARVKYEGEEFLLRSEASKPVFWRGQNAKPKTNKNKSHRSSKSRFLDTAYGKHIQRYVFVHLSISKHGNFP